jgi:hypothetical protein
MPASHGPQTLKLMGSHLLSGISLSRKAHWIMLSYLIGLFALPAACLVAMSSPAAQAEEAGCEPAGDYGFVCGIPNPEDLVHVPGTKWIIASSLAPSGGLFLVDSQAKSFAALYPGSAPRAVQDMQTFGACPGSPDPNTFVTHGLALRPGTDGRSTLYVVGHGGREAVEVFDVDASGETPVLTWKGCVLTPEGMEANSVAALADGSMLVTIPLLTDVPISQALAGVDTGGVFRWSPGDAAMVPVAGTQLPYANGIEVSADGKEFYVASSGLLNVMAYSNTDPAEVLRRTAEFGFIPDNLHMGADGRLVTAGLDLHDTACGDVKRSLEFTLEEFAACPRPFTVVAVDPQTMQVEVVATGPANPQFSNITMAVEVNDELWIGSFASDRIAYRSITRTRLLADNAGLTAGARHDHGQSLR